MMPPQLLLAANSQIGDFITKALAAALPNSTLTSFIVPFGHLLMS
jgi:hypothetical protein